MEEMKEYDGIELGGWILNSIRYADKKVLIADMEEKLQSLIDRLLVECTSMGLRINILMTEIMGVTKRSERLPMNILLIGTVLKQVENCSCAGSVLCEDGKSDVE